MIRSRSTLSVLLACVITAALSGCGKEKARAREGGEGRVVALQDPAPSLRSNKPHQASARPARTQSAASVTSSAQEIEDEESATTFTLTGRVTLSDGTPAPDTLIRVGELDLVEGKWSTADIVQTSSSADGRYRLRLPRGKVLSLRASRPGSVPVRTGVRFDQSEHPRIVTRNLKLESASRLRGRVVGPEDQPVSGTVVRFVPQTGGAVDAPRADASETTTSADGSFALDWVPEGELLLVVLSDDYVATSRTVTAPAEDVVIRLAGEGARVEGTVYDQSTREAVAGATVTLTFRDDNSRSKFDPWTATTDQFGTFSFNRLPAGLFFISARKEGLGLVPRKGARKYAVILGELETTSGLQLFLYPGHTLTGVVRDKTTSEPLSGVRVWSGSKKEDKLRAVETDSSGCYRLTGVFSTGGNDVPLSAEKKGYILASAYISQRSVDVTLKPDSPEIEQDLALVPVVTVSGTVKTEKGIPVPRAWVALVRNHGTPPEGEPGTLTDAQGRYELEAEPYSKARVKAEAKGWPISFSGMLDFDDRSTSADIVLKEGATVAGRVVDWRDSPVAGAAVKVNALVPTMVHGIQILSAGLVESGPDGSFSLGPLPHGMRLWVRTEKEGYADSRTETMSLQSGETKGDMKLILRESHTISGRVTDETSSPVAGASLFVH